MIERTEISRRTYKVGYYVVREIWETDYPPGTRASEHRQAYNKDDQWIGSPKLAWRFFHKYGIYPEYAHVGSSICSVGFSAEEEKWYGWSHRAIVGFGIGDKLFTEEFDAPDLGTVPFVERGSVSIGTLAQAREAAVNFAGYVA